MRSGFHYVVAGRRIDCDRPFPELSDLPAGPRDFPAIRVNLAPPRSSPEAVSWSYPPPGENESAEPPLRIGYCRDGYVLEYPGLGRFVVSPAGDAIDCFPASDVSKDVARHALLDKALPLALSLSGDVVLHAGAVAIGGHGVAVAGPSGRGKSTLVAHLGQHDAEVLTDDCLVLRKVSGEWHAAPYYQGVRLWPDSLRWLAGAQAERCATGDKQRVGKNAGLRYRQRLVPLRMIGFLAEDTGSERPALKRLSPREAFFQILSEVFSIELRAANALREQFGRIGQLADEVPTYAIEYPRRFAALASLQAALLATLSEAIPAAAAP